MKSRGRLFPKGGGADAARPTPSPPSGPMTRARAKLLQAKVNSLLSSCDFGLPLDGLLLHATTLCILSYEATSPHQAPKGEGPGGDAAGALHTGVSGLHRSLRTILRSGPTKPARDSLMPPPETGPEIDRSLRPRPKSPDPTPESPACSTPGMSRAFGP